MFLPSTITSFRFAVERWPPSTAGGLSATQSTGKAGLVPDTPCATRRDRIRPIPAHWFPTPPHLVASPRRPGVLAHSRPWQRPSRTRYRPRLRPAASPRVGRGHLRVFTYTPKTGALLARLAHSLRRYMPRFNVPVSDRGTRLAHDPENHHAATGQGTVRHRRSRVAGPPILVAVPAPYRPEAVSPSADAPVPELHCGSGASAVCHVRRVTL